MVAKLRSANNVAEYYGLLSDLKHVIMDHLARFSSYDKPL